MNQSNPYGDGRASERIASHLANRFGLSNVVVPRFEEVL